MADVRFTCDLCDKTYAHMGNLQRHKEEHEAGTQSKRHWGVNRNLWLNAMRTPGVPDCPVCGKTKCSTKQAMRCHARAHPEMLRVMKVHAEVVAEIEELARWAWLREPDTPSVIAEVMRRLAEGN